MQILVHTIGIIVILILLSTCLYFIGTMYGIIFGAPFVKTSKKVTRKMIKMAEVKKGDIVFDLGCGEGRLLYAAEEKGAKCIGVDISPPIIWLAKLKNLFKKKNVKFRTGNMFNQKDLHKANIIFLFTLPKNMNRTYKEIWPKLKKGTRIVSNAFQMKDLWPDKMITREYTGHNPVYLYIKK